MVHRAGFQGLLGTYNWDFVSFDFLLEGKVLLFLSHIYPGLIPQIHLGPGVRGLQIWAVEIKSY